MIDWNEESDLYVVIEVDKGPPSRRADHSGPLSFLIEIALKHPTYQRHGVEIKTASGRVYSRQQLEGLAARADRPAPILP